jgi:hypothetical protein
MSVMRVRETGAMDDERTMNGEERRTDDGRRRTQSADVAERKRVFIALFEVFPEDLVR